MIYSACNTTSDFWTFHILSHVSLPTYVFECLFRLIGVGKFEKICDGYADCPGKEDEMGCCGNGDQFRTSEPVPCQNFRCSSQSSNKFVAMDKVCNGFYDCEDGSDEEDCLVLAPREGFTSLANTDSKGFLYARVPDGGAQDYMLVGLGEQFFEDEVMLEKLARKVCNQHLEMSSGMSYSVQRAGEKDLVIVHIEFYSM